MFIHLRHTRSVVICLITLLGILGCEPEKPLIREESLADQAVLPLKIGNVWQMKTTYLDSLGAIIDSGSVSLTIFKDTTVLGEKWYKGIIAKVGSPTYWILYQTRSDGTWSFDSTSTPQLYLQYPADSGDNYLINGGDTRMTVLSVDTAVTVPAGTYSCLLFRSSSVVDDAIIADAYFSFEIGWIRTDLYDKTDNDVVYVYSRSELETLTINK